MSYTVEDMMSLIAEERILEAVERTKSSFTVPAVDKDGNLILDENGNQKQWCCVCA